jgi:hypothetical protein
MEEGTKDREERSFVFDQIRLEKLPVMRYGSLTDFKAGGILPL